MKWRRENTCGRRGVVAGPAAELFKFFSVIFIAHKISIAVTLTCAKDHGREINYTVAVRPRRRPTSILFGALRRLLFSQSTIPSKFYGKANHASSICTFRVETAALIQPSLFFYFKTARIKWSAAAVAHCNYAAEQSVGTGNNEEQRINYSVYGFGRMLLFHARNGHISFLILRGGVSANFYANLWHVWRECFP